MYVAAGTLLLLAGLAAPAAASHGGGGGHNGGGGGGVVDPALVSVTFTPATVTGGGAATGNANFAEAASQGAVVDLTSSDPSVASVPAQAVARPGESTAAFAVSTTSVTQPTTVTITATALDGGGTISGDLTVVPGTPPAADTVRITKLDYNNGLLRVEATDSNPNAVLNGFFGADTDPAFPLVNEGGGKYSFQQIWDTVPPFTITVRSNFGGSDSAEFGG